MLIRAKVSVQRRSRRKQKGYKGCGQSGLRAYSGGSCQMCDLCDNTAEHKSVRSGETWKINSAIDCDTKNVIYKLICDKCPFWLYIGESSRRAKDRFYNHRSNVSTKNLNTPAGRHFNLPGDKITDMIMVPFERVRPANDPFVRLVRESLWIKRYDAIRHGGNKRKWTRRWPTENFLCFFQDISLLLIAT